MQKYKALNKVWFCLVFLLVVMLMPQAGMAAGAPDEGRIIKPFMAVPFGSLEEQIVKAEGHADVDNYGYEKNFMGIDMRVKYYFFSNDRRVLDFVKVSFIKQDVTFAEVQQIHTEVTDMVKAQMRNPEMVARQYKRMAYEEGRTGEVSVVKTYLKDDSMVAALVFWWDADKKFVEAQFIFRDYTNPNSNVSGLLAIFNSSQPVEDFLVNEQEPAFVKYNWKMSQKDLKRIMGPPSETYKDGLGIICYYNDLLFGQPVEVSASFNKEGFFSPKKFYCLRVFFNMPCHSLDLAEAAGLKIVKYAAGKMSDAEAFGSTKLISFDNKKGWRIFGALSAPVEHALIDVRWDEIYEELAVNMLYYEGAMPDGYYKTASEDFNKAEWHIFFNAKP